MTKTANGSAQAGGRHPILHAPIWPANVGTTRAS